MPSTRGYANMAGDSEDSVVSSAGDGDWRELFLSGDESIKAKHDPGPAPSSNRVVGGLKLPFKPNFASWSSVQLKDHLREMGCMVSGNRDELIRRLGNYYDGNEVVAFG